MLDELRLEKLHAKEEKERKRTEAMQQWQAKMDSEQAKEDRKIMEKDLSTLSGHQLQYYLQRMQIAAAQLKIRSSSEGDDDKPGGSNMDESDDE
ncbi:hypothetical protein GIB67_028678 [Kingdonia uniflora]|uniref:No apical meristem-associated C-terminal domain-containing protein n=1 Tax=Kingdonia uniflora TaxID=39325 RepID=A0A7J7MTU3_9MAGN|nr:hypothetical protein GIB67_028678 [Kingdonia uniflora]